MKEMSRRELSLALPAFAVLGGVASEAKTRSIEGPLAHSKIFPLDTLTPKNNASGTVTRDVLGGKLATGEFIEVHETMLPAGMMPHPPHRHVHSEILLIRNGRIEVTSDGQTGIVEASGIIFTASNVLHSMKNIGETAANYFVVGVGGQQVID